MVALGGCPGSDDDILAVQASALGLLGVNPCLSQHGWIDESAVEKCPYLPGHDASYANTIRPWAYEQSAFETGENDGSRCPSRRNVRYNRHLV